MTDLRVALLRGINVGGRTIDGGGMVDIASSAGFADASSHQASGKPKFG